MTYIIAEPCIDIKDLSCVDVCPVDCIHVYERILVIDPEECIDCFAPEEQLLTTYGVRTFAELENQPVRVLTDSGFKPALVKRFRRKPLVNVELRPGVRGARPLRRHAADHAEHLSLPADGGGHADSQLVAGRRRADELARSRAIRAGDAALPEVRLGELPARCPARPRLRRRAWNKQEVRSGEHLHYVQLYGERVAKLP